MARFAKFKVPGELRFILINTDSIDWVDNGDVQHTNIHIGEDHVTVEASFDTIESLLEAEYGQVLDGTPSDG